MSPQWCFTPDNILAAVVLVCICTAVTAISAVILGVAAWCRRK